LSEAAGKVASGDFTVSVRPEHNENEADYLDVMIGDFNRMTAELRKVEILKTDFFSNVSHEFKTPLSVIQSYAGLLKKAASDSVQRDHTEQILLSVKKLNGLITNLLKLNLLEHQTIPAVRKPYNLCEQLEECALQFESVWEEKKIEFFLEMEDHVMIESDKDLLELVWSNLLSNAFKFTGSGGCVTLKQRTEGEDVLISVSDTGCGMDREMILHIFDPFYQGDTSRSSEGNGLGLALVRRILELCGGSVTVRSRLGEGSEFLVRFPIWRQVYADRLSNRKAKL
jgi:signal transduction histidine kinase